MDKKIIVAIVVYNRFENIKRWVHCWQQCEKYGAELIIIHTGIGDDIKNICAENNIKYVRRANQGFDIGCFQDICKERLKGFPNDWDYLLWIADDVMPMSKDFIRPFIDKLQNPKCGISCMENSKVIDPHVRTTCFCIPKSISRKLRFLVDPIKTKHDCYGFEHRAGKLTLANQVRAMGLSCDMVARKKTSPVWDTGYWERIDRQAEHERIFGAQQKNNKVVFICPIYEQYPQIISSLICQTYKNWELLLIHDGPEINGLEKIVQNYNDERIKFIIYPNRTGGYGHELRAWALQEIANGRLSSDVGYIVVTNGDNYHVPAYCEYLLSGFDKLPGSVAAYCSSMVHNYTKWNVLQTKFELGYIDSAGVMVKKDAACAVGWSDTKSHSSDWTYFSEIAAKYNKSNFVKVDGCLLVHN